MKPSSCERRTTFPQCPPGPGVTAIAVPMMAAIKSDHMVISNPGCEVLIIEVLWGEGGGEGLSSESVQLLSVLKCDSYGSDSIGSLLDGP